VFTAAGVLLLAWFAFGRGHRVPLLGLVDLGVHELGHLLFAAAPGLLPVFAGNGLQTALPLLVAAGFYFGRRDLPATGLCVAWSGTTLQDASVYIADAPYQALPLLKEGSIHDWAYILGPDHLDALGSAATIASYVNHVGLLVLVAGFCVCLSPLLLAQREPDTVETEWPVHGVE
jgi:hypothetical protein